MNYTGASTGIGTPKETFVIKNCQGHKRSARHQEYFNELYWCLNLDRHAKRNFCHKELPRTQAPGTPNQYFYEITARVTIGGTGQLLLEL
jgi:hypothetical protein